MNKLLDIIEAILDLIIKASIGAAAILTFYLIIVAIVTIEVLRITIIAFGFLGFCIWLGNIIIEKYKNRKNDSGIYY